MTAFTALRTIVTSAVRRQAARVAARDLTATFVTLTGLYVSGGLGLALPDETAQITGAVVILLAGVIGLVTVAPLWLVRPVNDPVD